MDCITTPQKEVMTPHKEAEINVNSVFPATEYDGMEPAREYPLAYSEDFFEESLPSDEEVLDYATEAHLEKDGLNVLPKKGSSTTLSEEIIKKEPMQGISSQPKVNIMSGPFYTVQKGDSLRIISKKFLGDPEKYRFIMELNGLASTMIIPGQVLKIPNRYMENTILYRVKQGDSLWSLAQRFLGYGPRYNEIMRINNLTGDNIYPGQVLKIPKQDINYNYANEYSSEQKFYIVKPGDTLWKIAFKMLGNGNLYTEIVRINNLDTSNIRVGQRILLP